MYSKLPCMIFSRSSWLCDEFGVLSVFAGKLPRRLLGERFLRSLGGDCTDFLHFCESTDASDYRLYHLRAFAPDGCFSYAFCEKITIDGETLTAVYLARNAARFYPLITPSFSGTRSFADSICAELMEAGYIRHSGGTLTETKALSLAMRVPYLTEALAADDPVRFCDIIALAETLVKSIASSPSVCAEINISHSPISDNAADRIVRLPVESLSSVLFMLCAALSSVSSDHRIDLNVSLCLPAADVTVSTVTDRISGGLPSDSVDSLARVGVRKDIIRTAKTLAYISDIDLYADFDGTSGKLSVTAGIGGEKQTPPDFKYSEPEKNIPRIVAETEELLDALTRGNLT